MAQAQNLKVEQVGTEGEGLVFIVYSDAIATMTGSFFWAIIFFFMLITLGLDSTFGGLEAMMTGLCDEYPNTLGKNRELFVACLLGGIYLCALPTCTYGGKDLITMLNVFGVSTPILFVVFVEAAGVCWFYGVNRFCDDVELMIGSRPGLFWRICWQYISPTFILIILIFSWLDFQPPQDMVGKGPDDKPPGWVLGVGWCMTLSSLWFIPTYAIYKFTITKGSFRTRIHNIITPEEFIQRSSSRDKENMVTNV